MKAVSGDLACQAAAFVYKDDKSAPQAWLDVEGIEHIRREIHGERASFLDALRAWNSQPRLEPGNASLAIYAHMGESGIGPGGLAGTANIVSWQELAAALPKGAQYCWLIGCKSEYVLSNWPASGGPVLRRILVTEESKYWGPLVQHFAEEISMDPVRFPEEMPSLLRKLVPTLGGLVEYYEPTPGGWQLCFSTAS